MRNEQQDAFEPSTLKHLPGVVVVCDGREPSETASASRGFAIRAYENLEATNGDNGKIAIERKSSYAHTRSGLDAGETSIFLCIT